VRAASRVDRWLRGLVLLAATCLGACGLDARLSVAPTLDTSGHFGFETRVSGGFGPADRDYAVTLEPYLVGGYYDQPFEQLTLGGGGAFSFTGVFEDSTACYGSIFGGGRGTIGATTASATGNFGVELAIGYAVYDHETPGARHFIRTDGEHEAAILGLGLRGEVVAGGPEARGLFAIPISLEWYWGT